MISFLNNRLGQLYMSHNMQRKAKRINTQIYCKDTQTSTQWECEDRPYKRKKQLKKGLIKKKNFTKQKYIPKKRYYKKKREFIKTKSKCKCYNYGEGHKSYECNKKRVKISKIDRIEIDSDLESIKSIESEDFFEEIYEECSIISEESD